MVNGKQPSGNLGMGLPVLGVSVRATCLLKHIHPNIYITYTHTQTRASALTQHKHALLVYVLAMALPDSHSTR